MDRYEHCMVEFYWSHPNGVDPVRFKPGFTVFYPDGRRESQEGNNAELNTLFNQLGAEGWRVGTGVTTSNWILWTLERKLG
jgi:hypothetical protein